MHDYDPKRDDFTDNVFRYLYDNKYDWEDNTDNLVRDDLLMWVNSKGQLHRDGDKPAQIDPGRFYAWYQNGKIYREGDKPTVIQRSHLEWRNDKGLHRDFDRPAVIDEDGYKEWWKNGDPYFPIESIVKSILHNPKIKLIKKYFQQVPQSVIESDIFIDTIVKVLTDNLDSDFIWWIISKSPEKFKASLKFQEFVCKINLAYINAINKDLWHPSIKEKLSGHLELDNIGL